jgi:hypothetical protein
LESVRVDLNQPSGLPVLLVYSAASTRGRGVSPLVRSLTVACIDKRNGKTVSNQKLNESYPIAQVECDVENHEIEIRFPRNRVRLTFTGKPFPAEQEEPNGSDSSE